MTMRLSKGKTVKRILAVFLALTVPAGSAYATEPQSPKENIINEGAAGQDETPAGEEAPQKRMRVIEVEEEVTKVCGEIFLLDVTLSERPKVLDGEENETDGGVKTDDAKEESVQEEAEDTEDTKGAEDTKEAKDIKAEEDTEAKQQESGLE